MITLENIESFSIPLAEHMFKHLFELEDQEEIIEEHKDQIIALTIEASQFLWNFENDVRIGSFYPNVSKYFRDVEEFSFGEDSEKEVKKWLFNRGIPFDRKVYISIQPTSAFVITWKILVKYSASLFFAHDLIIWDTSLNWGLYYQHDDIFHFGKHRIYDGEAEQVKLNEILSRNSKK